MRLQLLFISIFPNIVLGQTSPNVCIGQNTCYQGGWSTSSSNKRFANFQGIITQTVSCAGVLNLARTPKLLAGEFLKLAGEVFSKKITTAVVIFFGKITTKFSKKFTTAVNNIQNIIMLKNFIFSVVIFLKILFCGSDFFGRMKNSVVIFGTIKKG